MSIKKIFHYYWMHMRQRKMLLFLVVFFYGFAIVLADVITPLVYRNIIDVVSHTQPNASIAWELMWLMGVLTFLISIYMISFRIADFAIVRFEARIIAQLANFSFQKLIQHSREFFANNFSGSLVAKTRRFISSSERLFDTLIFNFWWTAIKLPALIISLAIVKPILAIILLVWTIVYVLVVVVMVRYGMRYDRIVASVDSKVTGQLADTITNILNVKMFASASAEFARFQKVIDEDYRARMTAWNFEMWQFVVQGVLLAILQIGGMYVAIRLWLDGSISAGTVVLVQMYFAGIFGTVWNLSKGMKNFVRGLTDAQEMVDIFELPPSVVDPDKPETCRISKGEMVFDHVAFSYGEHEENVFSDFNLRILPGQKIGIVGPSGAGKSTIASLLLRFADITKGTIRIDGQDIAKLTQDDLRKNIAYVPQDPILFHRTLRENIAYAKPDATHQEIVAVAKKAHAHEFITQLPNGYDTMVGERGVKLSGGQRQRIAIARAILKNAPILLLDEATSALDSESEQYIQDALAELMRDKTAIVIAHRLSTIRQMDRIIVLQNGKVQEDGTHDQLCAQDGIYNKLWNHQSGGFIV